MQILKLCNLSREPKVSTSLLLRLCHNKRSKCSKLFRRSSKISQTLSVRSSLVHYSSTQQLCAALPAVAAVMMIASRRRKRSEIHTYIY